MNRGPYIRPVRRFSWWLDRGRYVRYMSRELSCLFIGAWTFMLIVGLFRLWQGQPAFESFIAAIGSPAGILFNLVTFAFALYHTYTWFKVTPKAMPLSLAGKRIPGFYIVGVHWLAWCVAVVLVIATIGKWA